MDTEFHYWVTGIIAKAAGFSNDEAFTIACSSEYVDENDISYSICDRRSERIYRNFISQTVNIFKPKSNLLRIYPIFHFVPGDPFAESARRRDGKMHLLNTTPNGESALEMLYRAFAAPERTRLYRIGIATHAYADTWAHQNFVGWHDSFNHMDLDLKPNIGHADAGHHPDWMAHLWCDNRLVEKDVDNRSRFLSAANHIFQHYCRYLGSQDRQFRPEEWGEVRKLMESVNDPSFTGNKNRHNEERIKKYRDFAPWLPEFDERVWFSDAVDTLVYGLPDSHHDLVPTIFKDRYFWKEDVVKEETPWYLFQEAVKAHERYAVKLLSPLFLNMGFDLARI
ncbi:MAG: hypothetical protein C4582_11755 [Desulfobacteraceae bacterium]|jgi:hypothetical protein|nr:MAG: hypothetical protein C4582_11755 [Desulfobacteraceae bacterium]